MTDPSAPPIRPSEARARQRVGELLGWAVDELGLTPSALAPCDADLVASALRAQGVVSLAAGHDELLRRAGRGGPDTVLAEIFGSDLVGVDAMIGGPGQAPMRAVALELIERSGYGLDEFDVVIRVVPGREVEYAVTGSPDPPVWAFVEGLDDPVLRHRSFTEWLAFRVQRAVKRRHPLRHVGVPAAPSLSG